MDKLVRLRGRGRAGQLNHPSNNQHLPQIHFPLDLSLPQAVYPTFSFASHSCVSNCNPVVFPNRHLALQSKVRIARGEELTISYVSSIQVRIFLNYVTIIYSYRILAGIEGLDKKKKIDQISFSRFFVGIFFWHFLKMFIFPKNFLRELIWFFQNNFFIKIFRALCAAAPSFVTSGSSLASAVAALTHQSAAATPPP